MSKTSPEKDPKFQDLTILPSTNLENPKSPHKITPDPPKPTPLNQTPKKINPKEEMFENHPENNRSEIQRNLEVERLQANTSL